MNGCRSTLVQLGIPAVPITAFVAAWWISGSVFQIPPPFPFFIAAAAVVIGLVGFFWWVIALQKKEDEVLDTFEHPFFGTVKTKRKSWETSLTVPNLGSGIAVSSYAGTAPTRNQEEIVRWLSESADSIREELEECLDTFDRDNDTLPSRPRPLVFESLLLDPVEPKTFCISFDIQGAGLPWGFSAYYTAGELEEFTDDH